MLNCNEFYFLLIIELFIFRKDNFFFFNITCRIRIRFSVFSLQIRMRNGPDPQPCLHEPKIAFFLLGTGRLTESLLSCCLWIAGLLTKDDLLPLVSQYPHLLLVALLSRQHRKSTTGILNIFLFGSTSHIKPAWVSNHFLCPEFGVLVQHWISPTISISHRRQWC